MGGTSTDVCLIAGGRAERERRSRGRRVPDPRCRWSTSTRSVPAAARSSGGTTAAPCASARESAGADPGPGLLRPRRRRRDRDRRQPPARPAAGAPPRRARARRAPRPSAALGGHRSGRRGRGRRTPRCCGRLRVVSVERGHDPRDFALVAFGGAGPLHACALADELGCAKVLVPTLRGFSRRSASSRATSVATMCARTSARSPRSATCRGRRGEPALPRPVVRAHRRSGRRAGGALPPCARGALRLRRPGARGRARRRPHGRGRARRRRSS